jgi:hypothetical protein
MPQQRRGTATTRFAVCITQKPVMYTMQKSTTGQVQRAAAATVATEEANAASAAATPLAEKEFWKITPSK